MITHISTRDARYPIGSGHGSDAIHKDPIYSYAITFLTDNKGRTGTGSGLAFTLGEGNDLVCKAAEFYAAYLQGRYIEEITPISPPSGPSHWLFQGPPAESKLLAAEALRCADFTNCHAHEPPFAAEPENNR